MTPAFDTPRRLTAEALGTALLLAIVVGSGIMGERLSDGNDAIALLGNTIATGAGLVVLITVFGPISGAHFNPAVSLAFALRRDLPWRLAAAYVVVQLAGAVAGVFAAHAMFAEPILQVSTKLRDGPAQAFAELVATFGLLGTILGTLRFRPDFTPAAVGLYITAAYWFTASTSFANPAVTVARALSDTFAGIAPASAPAFIAAQVVGALLAVGVFGWLFSGPRRAAAYSRVRTVADRSPDRHAGVNKRWQTSHRGLRDRRSVTAGEQARGMRYAIIRGGEGLPSPEVQRQSLEGVACDVTIEEDAATSRGQRWLIGHLQGLRPGDEVMLWSLDVLLLSTAELLTLLSGFFQTGVALRLTAISETLNPPDDASRALSLLAEHERRRPSRPAATRRTRPSGRPLSPYQVKYARQLLRHGTSRRAVGLLFQLAPDELSEQLQAGDAAVSDTGAG